MALNFTGEAQTLQLSRDALKAGRAVVVISTWLDRESQVVGEETGAFVLRTDEGCVLSLL